jgi:hypothetical protein
MAEAVGMAWAAPFLRFKRPLMSCRELANALGVTEQSIYDTIRLTEQLETLNVGRLGSHYRITVRSALVMAWERWSGRTKATHRQILVFLLCLLKSLPTVALRAVCDACNQLIESREAAERKMGLEITASSPAHVREAFINGKRMMVAATKSGQTKPPPAKPQEAEPCLF